MRLLCDTPRNQPFKHTSTTNVVIMTTPSPHPDDSNLIHLEDSNMKKKMFFKSYFMSFFI